METLVDRDHLVCKVFVVPQVEVVPLEGEDLQECEESLVPMERTEKLVHKVFKVCPALQVPWETRDLLENLVEMEIPGLLETVGQGEIQEKMDHLVYLDHQALQVQLANVDHLVHQEQEDSKECLARLANLGSLVKMVMLEFLVNLV